MKSTISPDRNLLVGNLEKLAKNTQVGTICHINVKRSQETGNRQPKYCNPRAHAPSVNYRHNMSNTDTASLAGHTLLGLGVWSRCEAAVVPSTKAETHLILLEGL